MGTDGFEFVEYTAPDPQLLRTLFERLGFPVVARHRCKNVTLHSQGDINFVINAEPDSFGRTSRARTARPPARWRFACRTPRAAFERAWRSAPSRSRTASGPMELNIPAIEGIGGSLIYFVDRYGERLHLRRDFRPVSAPAARRRPGLLHIDHLTHNVHRGNMDKWAGFYEKLFNFREIRYFDIEGKKTGLFSRAHDQPLRQDPHSRSTNRRTTRARSRNTCASTTAKASSTSRSPPHDIYHTVDVLRATRRRVPGHARHVLRRRGCARRRPPRGRRGAAQAAHPHRRQPRKGEGVLLQIFTQNVIGPIFFEIIQRKGNEGFGEGNFRALFESIELDQIRRGVI